MSWNPPSAAGTPAPPIGDEFRPNAGAYFADMKKRAIFVVPLLAFFVIRNLANDGAGLGLVGVLALVGITVGVTIIGVITHMRTTTIRFAPGAVELAGALVADRTMPLDGTQQGVLAPVTQPMTPATSMLVLRSAASDTTIRLSGALWAQDDLEAIARRTGAAIETEPLSVTDVERRLPGSMPFWLRHPWLLAAAAVVVILVVVAGIVVAVM